LLIVARIRNIFFKILFFSIGYIGLNKEKCLILSGYGVQGQNLNIRLNEIFSICIKFFAGSLCMIDCFYQMKDYRTIFGRKSFS
jgi:hypothetical protein